jgi:hypothetical protein
MLSPAPFCSTGALNRIRPRLVQGEDWRIRRSSTSEDETMKTHVSPTGLAAAVMLFVIGVAMHEAARPDRLPAPGVSLIADGLVAKHVK